MSLQLYEKQIFMEELELLYAEYIKCPDSTLKSLILEDIRIIEDALSLIQ
ncbi:MAG: hypothetical protein ACI35R_09830 [Bacillus sp. (in: firmicutes)]